ncbi:hypothetical protein BCR34DRAFT_620143 [Clohesyomyces aquaticus]|uniref:Uncharacterized protein n=1 Tax=Clohesyomyces aquaticus TaxID=1231657 RepID=A0A1Y1Y8Y8_9PLEO|nr:hypothetical protein BCR34DRAFT_620143 [Clohesyomyces aquaticus]
MTPSTFSRVQEQTLFAQLKQQIITLATALYGTHTLPSSFDVLTHISSSPASPSSSSHLNPNPNPNPNFGVALITYLPTETPLHGPGQKANAGYTSWELISKTSGHESVNMGMEALLGDLRVAVGGVMVELERKNEFRVAHKRIPDLAVEGEDEGAGKGAGTNGDLDD